MAESCKKRRRQPRFVLNEFGKYEKPPVRKRPHTNRHLHEKRLMDQLHRQIRLWGSTPNLNFEEQQELEWARTRRRLIAEATGIHVV